MKIVYMGTPEIAKVCLEKLYTEKISSRLSAFVPIRFLGEDIRPQKASE